MTVRDLIRELLDCDMDAEVQVYVSATKGEIEEAYMDAETDSDYVLDNFCGIDNVEEYHMRYGDKRTEVRLYLEDFG